VSRRPRGERVQRALVAGVALLVCTAAEPADPPVQSADRIEEITVTGPRKRSEAIQDVPQSIQAFSADDIRDARIQGYEDIFRLTTNASVEESANGDVTVSIRGIDTGSPITESGLGLYVDGAYAYFRGVRSNVSLFDLESVEVLRGPQGGLYGRNSIGGALLINTARPRFEFGTSAKLRVGSDAARGFEGMVNLPIVPETLALRVAYTDSQRDSFFTNRALGRRERDPVERAGRAKLRYSDGPVDLVLGYERWRDVLSGLDRTLAQQREPTPRATFASVLGGTRQDSSQWNANLAWEASDALELRYLGSYREFRRGRVFDLDGSDQALVQVQGFESDQQTHELRLTATPAADLTLSAGAVYYRDHPEFSGSSGTPGNTLESSLSGVFDNISGFTELEYELLPGLRIAGELGYSVEENAGSRGGLARIGSVVIPLPSVSASETERVSTPGASVSWFVNEAVMLYGRYSTSYKSGGFNDLSDVDLATGEADRDLYFRPEKVRGFEIGAKGQWLDDRLLLNAAVFDMRQRDLQTRISTGGTGAFERRPFLNVGSARRRGAEVELRARPVGPLELSLGYGLTDAELEDSLTQSGDASGNAVPGVPRYTFNAGVQYRRPLLERWTLFLRTDYTSRLGGYRDIANVVELDDTALTSLRFGLELDERFAISFFGRNVFDREYFEVSPEACIVRPGAGLERPADQICDVVPNLGVPNAPRVVGVEIELNW